ncbi:MAG: CPBP family intramembrane metalloprotease [Clostridiales bacterium]|nr:CPBP family intramembrane metalloprotease [Clostridiales bacterium]
MKDIKELKKHSASVTILLHLVPGLINIAVYASILPLAKKSGVTLITAYYLTVLASILPVQLSTMIFVDFNIFKLIPCLKKSKVFEYLAFTVVFVAYVALLARYKSIENNYIWFVPAFKWSESTLTEFSKGSLIFTSILGMFTHGIIAPLTEEFYFRGYLLSRINLSPFWAVVVNTALFSLYNFFSPWGLSSRLFIMLPVYYWVMKKNNIKFSIVAHMSANLFYSSINLIAVLSM